MSVTHFQAVRGLGSRTSCGRSLHGWSRDCPKNVTEAVREVDCKKCLKVLGREYAQYRNNLKEV